MQALWAHRDIEYVAYVNSSENQSHQWPMVFTMLFHLHLYSVIKYLSTSHIWIYNRVVQNVSWPVIVAVAESSNRDGEGLPHWVQCVLDHLCLVADGEPASKITDIRPLKGEHIHIAHVVPVKIIPHHFSFLCNVTKCFAGCCLFISA